MLDVSQIPPAINHVLICLNSLPVNSDSSSPFSHHSPHLALHAHFLMCSSFPSLDLSIYTNPVSLFIYLIAKCFPVPGLPDIPVCDPAYLTPWPHLTCLLLTGFVCLSDWLSSILAFACLTKLTELACYIDHLIVLLLGSHLPSFLRCVPGCFISNS